MKFGISNQGFNRIAKIVIAETVISVCKNYRSDNDTCKTGASFVSIDDTSFYTVAKGNECPFEGFPELTKAGVPQCSKYE